NERQGFSGLVTGTCTPINDSVTIPDSTREGSYSEWMDLPDQSPIIRIVSDSYVGVNLELNVEFQDGRRESLRMSKSDFVPSEYRDGKWQTIVAGLGSGDMDTTPQRIQVRSMGNAPISAQVQSCSWG